MIRIWKVHFGDSWSAQTVEARNIDQAMRKARRLHVKETRDNGWSRKTENLPITAAELMIEVKQ